MRGRPARPVGIVTRGTTNPNRLRRFDRWIIHRIGPTLATAPDPLVVDLGFGVTPVTTVELAARLHAAVGRPVEVLGLEIDPVRVAQALPMAGARVAFTVGGFEVPAPRPPLVIRAANVLRQYPRDEVPAAWTRMVDRLAPGGVLVEGTCDELGRLGAWVTIPAGSAAPESLTFGLDLRSLVRPSTVAERLPKVLIHDNVDGQRIHDLLTDLDRAWERAAPQGVFGPRQRWLHAVAALHGDGWPIADGPARWRLGELTVAWSAVAPAGL